MTRLLIVSNRLPLTAKLAEDVVSLQPSMGGLVTGVSPVRRKHPSVWIGWPGDTSTWSERTKDRLLISLQGEGCCPVLLTAAELRGFYQECSNEVLWPLYHSLSTLLPEQVRGWDEYQQVNQRFAAAVAAEYRPGDLIWVHDFQLTLVPQMVRALLPGARIGFFLHIPFPPAEIFRILPMRRELLLGMLGADVVGFHTGGYAGNFASAVLAVVGREAKGGTIKGLDSRTVRFGAFPLGVDFAAFETPRSACAMGLSLLAIRQANPEVKLMLAVDRLDYTKGIPRRLLAFERLLEMDPELIGKVIFFQIAVPSRSEIVAFEDQKRSVDEIVGRINGRFGSPSYHPIHYFVRSFNREELIELYRGVDTMVVTPLRDGMNLVAKEFCASRVDGCGVLVLSEFAGAAVEMREALLVNPYDLTGTARAYAAALRMSEEEARRRMRTLREGLKLLDHQAWSQDFLACLQQPVKMPTIIPRPSHPSALWARRQGYVHATPYTP